MNKITVLKNKIQSVVKSYLSDEITLLKKKHDFFIFLIFLFVSTTFWFLNALRNNYVANFSFPVQFVNVPDNEIVVGTDKQFIQLKVKGTGFSILRQYLSNSFSSPTYDVSKLRRVKLNGANNAFLISREQRKHFSGQLFMGMELVEISPDTVFVEIQKFEKRKVPVKFNGRLKFEKQFLLSGDVSFDPDSVEVSGPKNIVDTLSSVLTKYFIYEKVRDSLVRNVALMSIKDLTISDKSASMLIPVEPFSETSILVPITVTGLADSLRGKTFPSEVSITFRTGLSKFEKISSSDFSAIVDASSVFNNEQPSRLKVKIEKYPSGIYSMDYSPIFVEYLIERKR